MTMVNQCRDVIRAVVPRSTRNWLRSPSKSAEWLWDSARFLFGNTESLEISPNSYLVCHPRAHRVFHRDQIGDPEQIAEFRGFISHCSSSMLLYDIGAHFGIFSLTAAHFGGTAVAVDASPAAAHMIEIEAALNKCAGRVHIIRAAVNDMNGTMAMLSSGVFSDGYFTATKRRPGNELTRVRAVTIDEMVLQFGPPTHIKIDVEGHEAAVLRGASATLSQFAPVLFLELHNEMVASRGDDPKAPLNELAHHRYDTFMPNGDAVDTDAIFAKPIIRIVAKHRRG